MSFTTGTADNQVDLLDKLRTYVTGLGVPWTSLAYTAGPKRLKSVAINFGGLPTYAVNDILTVSGGTFTTAAQIKVTTVAAGVITGVTIQTVGSYTALPGNPVSVTGGGGTTATFNLTFEFIPTTTVPLQLRGPGNGSGSEVFININAVSDLGNGFYGWQIYGATGYTAAIAFGAQPGAGGPVYFNLASTTLSYWFYVNTRRIIVIAKSSTNYMSAYAGFLLPQALPSEYPQPLYIAASYPTLEAPSINNARNSSIADPGTGAAYYLKRTSLVWESVNNQASTGSSVLPAIGQRAFVWPTKTGRGSATTSQTTPDEWNAAGFHLLRLNANSESPLIQCHLADLVDGTFVGALDGVYACTGSGRAVEGTITASSRTWRLFQRAFRTAAGDFFAVEEV